MKTLEKTLLDHFQEDQQLSKKEIKRYWTERHQEDRKLQRTLAEVISQKATQPSSSKACVTTDQSLSKESPSPEASRREAEKTAQKEPKQSSLQ